MYNWSGRPCWWWYWYSVRPVWYDCILQNESATLLISIYILIIPILCVCVFDWHSIGRRLAVNQSAYTYETSATERRRRTATCRHVCLLVITALLRHLIQLHNVGRGAVLYQLTDIPHKEVIALSLCARPLAAARAWTAYKAPMSSSLLNITVGASIMLLRNMDRARGHGNGTR